MKAFLPILFAALLLAACQTPKADVSMSPESGCWRIQDTLTVERDIQAPTVEAIVDLLFEQTYAYANLQMKLLVEGPDGAISDIPFQSVVLTPQGDWQLEKQAGQYPLTLQLKDPVPTPEAGTYRFSLLHNMREDEICDIPFVGLSITETP